MSANSLMKRLRAIQWSWLGLMVLTAISVAVFREVRPVCSGLLLGEVGGLFVIFSMIRQGHLNDDVQGQLLFASGMMGMFARLALIVVIMVISLKFKALFNPYAALVGYALSFVFIIIGMYRYAKNPPDQRR
ncbi:hypothetical protein IW967_03490 [Alicyclobacillus mali]|uniref:ATP synthase protein I n=1 Tax=Alicyclobacillus mali (ex Roth et al. 2021) TaxID=1123961 RepID=A0ABS0F0V2_9BACL|nr:hypothetical protein [Alicyclobacillus mali (ex Roth et al. 2021)]MBF8376938.1 hypothetical protein [Alicyclobacillus mali (ex Roth et al. 2021)]